MLAKSKDSNIESCGDYSGELENEDGQNENEENELDHEWVACAAGDPGDSEDPEDPEKDSGKKPDSGKKQD